MEEIFTKFFFLSGALTQTLIIPWDKPSTGMSVEMIQRRVRPEITPGMRLMHLAHIYRKLIMILKMI
jgi:hypothetical protein